MTRLLLDAMCGGIRAHLRMCGHDAAYALDRGLEGDDALLAAATAEGRTVVTRDRDLADRAGRSILLESTDPEEQLAAVAAAGIDLTLADPPERCGRCNGRLAAVPETESTEEYAPDPGTEAVWQCLDCGQYFWKGSHWERVARTLP